MYKFKFIMPEGPELKVMCDNLNQILDNTSIIDINILSGRYYPQEKNPKNFNELKNQLPLKLKEINVKGKLLYFIFENNWVILNTMGMSGRWTNTFQKHSHIELIHENGKLWFTDIRRFGTIKILKDIKLLTKKLDSLGPDMLNSNITCDEFLEIMKKHKKKNITKVLMNQSIISGCGNYIKSESLYRSRISPHNKIEDIDVTKIKNLFYEMKKVMNDSYKSQGATISTYYNINDQEGKYKFEFQVYGRVTDDLSNKIIREKTLDGRTSYWVKSIQN